MRTALILITQQVTLENGPLGCPEMLVRNSNTRCVITQKSTFPIESAAEA